MILEEYKFKDRPTELSRLEDNYTYGYELYRVGVTGNYLVQLCIGAYGFKTKELTIQDATNRIKYIKLDEIFSIYAKIYNLDNNREVIHDSIELLQIKDGIIKYIKDGEHGQQPTTDASRLGLES